MIGGGIGFGAAWYWRGQKDFADSLELTAIYRAKIEEAQHLFSRCMTGAEKGLEQIHDYEKMTTETMAKITELRDLKDRCMENLKACRARR
ncbi:MAG: hypothetical protein WBK91_06615 [Alphaproteobacteria bacterium]